MATVDLLPISSPDGETLYQAVAGKLTSTHCQGSTTLAIAQQQQLEDLVEAELQTTTLFINQKRNDSIKSNYH
jgi:hypothetical protein